MTTTPTCRDYTIERDSSDEGVAVLCRSDSDCYENQPNETGRYLTLGEAVDWAQKHAADHAKWDAERAQAGWACTCPPYRFDATGQPEALPQGTNPNCPYCHPGRAQG